MTIALFATKPKARRRARMVTSLVAAFGALAGPLAALLAPPDPDALGVELSVEPAPTIGPHGLVTDPAILAQRILAAHNGVRTRYGAPALVWDKGLSVDAAAYVRSMAATGRFEHADQKAQGENLWMGSAGFYTIEDMTGSWAAESQMFRAGRFPDVSTHGGWTAVGHFTQMIWPSTTHVGCAIARNQTDDYLVCRYRPAGNIIGTNLP